MRQLDANACRDMLDMHEDGSSIAEIAQWFGFTPPDVRAGIDRALKRKQSAIKREARKGNRSQQNMDRPAQDTIPQHVVNAISQSWGPGTKVGYIEVQ